MLDDKIKLDAFKNSIKKEIEGSYIYIRNAQYKAELTLFSSQTQSSVFTIKTGSVIKNLDFSAIQFVNLHNGANKIDYVAGNGEFVETALAIADVLETQQRSGSGQLYKTETISGVTKILGFDNDRLFFSIENRTDETLKIGGVDVLQNHIEISAGKKYSDSFASINEIWANGNGKICVASKYKTQQKITQPKKLASNDKLLSTNSKNLTAN